MLARLLGRLGQSVLVLLVVSMVSFLVFRYIGDPTVSLLGEDASVPCCRSWASTSRCRCSTPAT